MRVIAAHRLGADVLGPARGLVLGDPAAVGHEARDHVDHARAIRLLARLDVDHRDQGHAAEREPGAAQQLGEAGGQVGMGEALLPRLEHPGGPLSVAGVPHAGFPVRIEHREPAPRLQHARGLRQPSLDVRHVLVDLHGGDEVEGAGREWQRLGVRLAKLGAAGDRVVARALFAGHDHGRDRVDAHDAPGRAHVAGQLAGEQAEAAADVQTALATARRDDGADAGPLLGHVRGGA